MGYWWRFEGKLKLPNTTLVLGIATVGGGYIPRQLHAVTHEVCPCKWEPTTPALSSLFSVSLCVLSPFSQLPPFFCGVCVCTRYSIELRDCWDFQGQGWVSVTLYLSTQQSLAQVKCSGNVGCRRETSFYLKDAYSLLIDNPSFQTLPSGSTVNYPS